MTRLPLPALLGLFALGAVLSPLGDHVHVSTGTTYYAPDAWPFVADSPLWFPLAVGLGTASLAEIRVRLGALRPEPTVRWAVGGLAALMATYALTGLLRDTPVALGLVVVGGIAITVWSVLGDLRSVVCGVVAAVVGVATEAVLAARDAFGYAEGSDQLFGVAPWLLPLYFTFGVVVAVVGELVADHGRTAT